MAVTPAATDSASSHSPRLIRSGYVKRCLACAVRDKASWNEPVEGRRSVYSRAPWMKALSRWMCGCVSGCRASGWFDVG